jgi:hypothetical protein
VSARRGNEVVWERAGDEIIDRSKDRKRRRVVRAVGGGDKADNAGETTGTGSPPFAEVEPWWGA